MSATMRVRVELSLDIDLDEWAEAEGYLGHVPAADIRAEVKAYVESLVDGYMNERHLLVRG